MAEAAETDEGEDVHHRGVGDGGGTGMPTSKGTRLKMANRVNICLEKRIIESEIKDTLVFGVNTSKLSIF